jgi:WD40 repeat protein
MSSSSTTLSHRVIFGINGNVTDNISFIEDDTIVYVAGQNVVIYNKTERKQRFIYGSEKSEGVTAFTAGSGKRFIAVAEKGEKIPQISVFDMRTFRKRKTLVPDPGSKEFISMQFSEDNQLLLTLTGAPDYQLCCWSWSKARIIASANVGSVPLPMHRCSFSPIDATMSCVTGKDSIKFYRIAERELRVVNEASFEGHNFTCHVWLRKPEDHVIAATDTGDYLLFKSGEYVCHLKVGNAEPVYSLLSVAKGFVSGSREGSFVFVEFDGDEVSDAHDESFACRNTWSTDLCSGSIVSLALSPTEDLIGALSNDNQMLYMSTDVVCSAHQSHDIEKIQPVKHVFCSFHGPKPIVGMDVCYRKPLIVTCSRDNSVKIWNYQTNELELNKVFPEDTNCVSMHPSGLQIAVGFSDKLRVYHVLVDDLKLCQEVPIKNCRECRFSNGGHFLGVANGNTVSVFSFHTGEKVADLRGHNSKIRSLFWLENGTQLLSCGQDGAVYLWDVEDMKRAGELVRKGIMFTSVCAADKKVFCTGNDMRLKELELPDLAVKQDLDEKVLFSNVAASTSKGVVFAATADPGRPGVVRSYVCPVTGDFQEYPCMGSAITRMKLTPDHAFLAVADETGCLIIFDLTDRFKATAALASGGPPGSCHPEEAVGDWTDEVLVTRADLEDRKLLVLELNAKVDELKLQNDYRLRLKEMSYAEAIKELSDKFNHELEQAVHKLDLLKEEKNDSDIEHTKRIKQMEEKHQHDMQETETEFQTQIMEEVGKYQQLVRARDAQAERLAEQRRLLIATQSRYIQELTSDFEQKLYEERQLRMQLDDDKLDQSKALEETKNQLEDDVDTEVEMLRKSLDERLAQAREVTLKYKGENGIMKKKFAVIQKDMEDQKETMKLLLDQERELQEQIKVLEKEVSAHKKEIKLRDGAIGDKEKRIYELKKKNQELDKFKFVLDFKIRELKRQVEPRQLEIQGMKDQIKDMDLELEKYHKTNTALDNNIGEYRETIDVMQADVMQRRIRAKQLENVISRFKSELHAAVTLIQNPLELRLAIERIFSEYIVGMAEIKASIEPEVEQEYERHREYLSRSVLQLKKQLTEATAGHGRSNRDIMQENMNLIAVINAQREGNRELKNKVQAGLGRLQHLARVAARSLKTSGAAAPPPDLGSDIGTEELRNPILELERNRARTVALRTRINSLENKMMMQKAYSREVLPPIDGVYQEYPNEDVGDYDKGEYRRSLTMVGADEAPELGNVEGQMIGDLMANMTN